MSFFFSKNTRTERRARALEAQYASMALEKGRLGERLTAVESYVLEARISGEASASKGIRVTAGEVMTTLRTVGTLDAELRMELLIAIAGLTMSRS